MTEQNSRNRKFAAVCVLALVVLLLCGSGEGQNGFPSGSMDSSIVSSATAVSFPRSKHGRPSRESRFVHQQRLSLSEHAPHHNSSAGHIWLHEQCWRSRRHSSLPV